MAQVLPNYILSAHSNQEKIKFFHLFLRTLTQQGLKFKGKSRWDLMDIYTAEVPSLSTAPAKMKNPTELLVGKCVSSGLPWSLKQESS